MISFYALFFQLQNSYLESIMLKLLFNYLDSTKMKIRFRIHRDMVAVEFLEFYLVFT